MLIDYVVLIGKHPNTVMSDVRSVESTMQKTIK